MVLTSFPAGPLAANCYVIAAATPGPCVVVDPGQQAMVPLGKVLDEHRLVPAAVLLTHGHFDHIASARAVCDTFDIEAHIGAGDEPLLVDPTAGLSAEFAAMLPQFLGPDEDLTAMRPARVVTHSHDVVLQLAGLTIEALMVPGHTPGSISYRLATPGDEADVVFTGDTLFAGSVGRTDLPGGSARTQSASIAAQLLTLPDATIVLPGHGPATTIGAERTGNPFLAG